MEIFGRQILGWKSYEHIHLSLIILLAILYSIQKLNFNEIINSLKKLMDDYVFME